MSPVGCKSATAAETTVFTAVPTASAAGTAAKTAASTAAAELAPDQGTLTLLCAEKRCLLRIFAMNQFALRRRAQEIADEADKKQAEYRAGRITKAAYTAWLDTAHAESEDIKSTLKAFGDAKARYAGAADLSTGGRVMSSGPDFPGSDSSLMNPYLQSPTQLEPAQVQALTHAMRTKSPLTLEVGNKGWRQGVEYKSPLTEGGLATPLPGIEMPNQYLSFPYEPTRIATYLPGAAMDGPSAFYLQETAHAAEAAPVAENTAKPDLGPTLVNHQVVPTKLAAQFSVTLEMQQDAPGDISGFILNSLQRSIINQENSLLLNAVSGTNSATFNGFLSASGTLSLNATGMRGADAIITAAAAMRTNSGSFAAPDLQILSPNTAANILMEKDDEGRYLYSMLFGAGPNGLAWDGGADTRRTTAEEAGGVVPIGANGGQLHLAGIPTIQTTSIADNEAVLLSIKNGAGVYWTRLNMLIQFDPYTGLTNNTFRYVAETRIALSVPRPAAVSVISNLA